MADIKVRVGQQNATKVISSLAGAQTLSLTELSDVNVSGTLQNGMVLVFNGVTKKFDATLELTPRCDTEFRHQRRKFLKWFSIIRIKRSSGTAKPASLNWGEMAYVTGIGQYGGANQYKDRVFLGDDGTNVNPVAGHYYTSMMEHTLVL